MFIMDNKTFSFAPDFPVVMGILNVTPDSFYAGSRCCDAATIARRAETLVREGATIIDVGACSTRPGAEVATIEEELARLQKALIIVREVAPTVPISVDTFRAVVARRAVEDYGANIINDIGGGTLDAEMFPTVAALRVPYILCHTRGLPREMQTMTEYADVVRSVRAFFVERVAALRALGVKNIILDPGFGFAKTLEQNYELLARLGDVAIDGLPLLVGVSRKSMVYRPLATDADHALNGTTVLHALALQAGASILRVHDVREAVETVTLWQRVKAARQSSHCNR